MPAEATVAPQPLTPLTQGTSGPSASPSAPSQTSRPASRRASQIHPMHPPPLPLGVGGIPPSAPGQQQQPPLSRSHSQTQVHGHGVPFPPLSPSHISPQHGLVPAEPAVPMRHPRPLTAAELHLELEKEQEAVVNRLTRELSALRAHSASVASTASSTVSSGVVPVLDPTEPVSSRRHRSSSSISRTSMSAHAGPPTSFSSGLPVGSGPTSHRVSSPQHMGRDGSVSGELRGGGMGVAGANYVSTPRYEEVSHFRHELEVAQKENAKLKQRIRELERLIKGEGSAASGAGRGRTGAPGSAIGNAGEGETAGDVVAGATAAVEGERGV